VSGEGHQAHANPRHRPSHTQCFKYKDFKASKNPFCIPLGGNDEIIRRTSTPHQRSQSRLCLGWKAHEELHPCTGRIVCIPVGEGLIMKNRVHIGGSSCLQCLFLGSRSFAQST
jgi:hypothetical protein